MQSNRWPQTSRLLKPKSILYRQEAGEAFLEILQINRSRRSQLIQSGWHSHKSTGQASCKVLIDQHQVASGYLPVLLVCKHSHLTLTYDLNCETTECTYLHCLEQLLLPDSVHVPQVWLRQTSLKSQYCSTKKCQIRTCACRSIYPNQMCLL